MVKKKKFHKVIIAVMASMMMVLIFDMKVAKAEEKEFIEKIASFATGSSSEDGGAAEIVKYNKDNNKFYVINGIKSTIHVVTLDKNNSNLVEQKEINVKDFVEHDGFFMEI